MSDLPFLSIAETKAVRQLLARVRDASSECGHITFPAPTEAETTVEPPEDWEARRAGTLAERKISSLILQREDLAAAHRKAKQTVKAQQRTISKQATRIAELTMQLEARGLVEVRVMDHLTIPIEHRGNRTLNEVQVDRIEWDAMPVTPPNAGPHRDVWRIYGHTVMT